MGALTLKALFLSNNQENRALEIELGKMEAGEDDDEGDERCGPTMLRRVLNLGKKAAIAGAAITSAPVVVPPLLLMSAVAFPFGVYLASYAATNKLMSSLLPTAQPELEMWLPASEWNKKLEEEEGDYQEQVAEAEDGDIIISYAPLKEEEEEVENAMYVADEKGGTAIALLSKEEEIENLMPVPEGVETEKSLYAAEEEERDGIEIAVPSGEADNLVHVPQKEEETLMQGLGGHQIVVERDAESREEENKKEEEEVVTWPPEVGLPPTPTHFKESNIPTGEDAAVKDVVDRNGNLEEQPEKARGAETENEFEEIKSTEAEENLMHAILSDAETREEEKNGKEVEVVMWPPEIGMPTPFYAHLKERATKDGVVTREEETVGRDDVVDKNDAFVENRREEQSAEHILEGASQVVAGKEKVETDGNQRFTEQHKVSIPVSVRIAEHEEDNEDAGNDTAPNTEEAKINHAAIVDIALPIVAAEAAAVVCSADESGIGASIETVISTVTEETESATSPDSEEVTTVARSFISVASSAFASEMEPSSLSSKFRSEAEDNLSGVTDEERSTVAVLIETTSVGQPSNENGQGSVVETVILTRTEVLTEEESGSATVTDPNEPKLVSHSFASVTSSGFTSEMEPSSMSSEYASAVEDRLSGATDTEGDSIALATPVLHSDNEGFGSEEKIWEQISALRLIVGYKSSKQPTLVEELKALYIFTGVEPPVSLEETSDTAEIGDKLRCLKAVIGVI